MTTEPAELLTRSRFYGAKSEPIDTVTVVESAPAPGGRLELWEVTHGQVTDTYQMLVDDSGEDVLGREDVATEYGRLLARGEAPGFGTVHGTAPLREGDTGRALKGEQSNTSLLFTGADGSGSVMVKVFRKLEDGLSPDVELLSEIPDCPNVAPVRGWITHGETTLAMIQDFVAGGRDGWQGALDVAAAGDSFADEARELGRAMRTVHEHLAQAFGTREVPAREIGERLARQAEEAAERFPSLVEHLPAARSTFKKLEGTVAVQRVHGDLHLGQVLRTDDRYVLIDFEGEPARALAQRRLPDSPLRDVAGMLRSLDYAAHFPVTGGPGLPDASAWVAEASAALLEGYGTSPSPLLDAYLLDKALYEVGYELNNRPDWAWIPTDAVRRITDPSTKN